MDFISGRQTLFGSISTVNSFSGITNNTASGMENKFVRMKRLISTIEKYTETRADDQAIVINQHLQALSLTLDLSVFDPHTNIAGNFFISIYDLMSILEPKSLTSWYCVDVLLNACKNASARQALMNTYQFLPCLARMVSDQLTTEKRSRLLRLMQDITCGIKIYWQIPHMTHLMSMLCKWIERQETDVVALSLGVLVNLCYKNVSSVYILQRSVDLKKFIRMCLALKGPIVEVYVCQVTIILENVSGYVPAVVFPKFIGSTFTAVLEAYKRKDNVVLKQVVVFFMEYVKNNSSHLSGYDQYAERVNDVLEIIESSEDISKGPECLSVVLDFINFLIEIKVPQISSHYTKIIPLALKWIQESTVSFHALAILRTVAVNVGKKENNILESLIVGLNVFLFILNSCKEEGMMINSDYIKRLGALLQLLTAMIQVKTISAKVSQELSEEVFTNIFFPLLGDDSPRSGESTCSTDAVNLYIYALALVAKLVDCNNSWIGLLNSLLGNRQIHVIIAQAICYSPADVRKIALELSGSCSDGVSFALTNLQSIMSTGKDACGHVSSPQANNDLAFSLIPTGQHERLHTVLETVEDLIAKDEVKNIATSELMELYNYKLSYLAQAERAALASVEASTKHCTHLQYRISRLTCEHAKLQQSEFHNIQKLEEITKKKDELIIEVRDLQNRFEAEKGRYKAIHSQFLTKEKALGVCEVALKDTETKLSKLQQLFNKVEENCRRHEKNEQKKEEQLKNANESIKNLTMQVNELEKCLTEKQKTLDETKSMLQLKSSILDNIMKMANTQHPTMH